MEKAKAYIKNELRGGSLSLQTDPASTPPPTPQGHGQHTVSHASEMMPSPLGGGYHAQQYYATPSKSTGRASAPPEHVATSVCFVCGGFGSYEAIRIRANPERPGEAHFPFLERHEPPVGVPAVAGNQVYVMACMLCFRSLHEQWDSYERQKKPLLQRIYHMKRVDGKGYIGADVATQSEYAAQMLGLSAEHLSQNGLAELHNAAAAPPPPLDPYTLGRHFGSGLPQSGSPQLPQHHSTSRNASPDYFPRNATPTSHSQSHSHSNHKYLSRPQSRDMQQLPSPLSRPPSEPPARQAAPGSSSSFAQHKFKLGLGQHGYQQAPAVSGAQYQPAQYQQLQQQTAAYHMLQQVAAGSTDSQAHYKGNPYNAIPNHMAPASVMPLSAQPPSLEDDNATVLDLRNSSTVNPGPLTTAAAVETATSRNHPSSSSSASELGILDLSMPDKNSITEVCYVCGDEQRRGSLVELSTVKPKELRPGQAVPYFPLFNEQHPRPPRSRPKDPRGMIQACMPCHEDLMQQWNAHQVRLFMFFHVEIKIYVPMYE